MSNHAITSKTPLERLTGVAEGDIIEWLGHEWDAETPVGTELAGQWRQELRGSES